MDNLGSRNLFVSHFIMGTHDFMEFTKTETDETRVLHKWLNYKEDDYGMRSYRRKGTQYVDFLHLIDLANLKLIIEDLKSIYKENFPFSEKEDFIKACFEYSLYGLEDFIKEEHSFYGPMWNDEPFEFYYFYDKPFSEYIDYVIDKSKSIEYYKQYYKKVIQLVNGIDYDDNTKTVSPIQQELKTKKQELKESLMKYGFSKLEKVKALSAEGQNGLIDLLSENELPYCIAMLEYLKFLPYLEEMHASTKKGAQIIISTCFKSDSDGRAVRGNFDSLVKPNKRYTAYLHKETVIKDYQELTKGVPLM